MADGAVAQALVLEAPRRLVVRELPLPELRDDDALVRVAACGLCGADHEQFTGELGGPAGPVRPAGQGSIGAVSGTAWPISAGFFPSTASPACGAGCAPPPLKRPVPGS
jgi:alcohol dehydrogenase